MNRVELTQKQLIDSLDLLRCAAELDEDFCTRIVLTQDEDEHISIRIVADSVIYENDDTLCVGCGVDEAIDPEVNLCESCLEEELEMTNNSRTYVEA